MASRIVLISTLAAVLVVCVLLASPRMCDKRQGQKTREAEREIRREK